MTAKTFLAKLNTLAATPGKKDKLEIVKSFDEIDLALAKAALDPTINYYIAKLDPVVPSEVRLQFDDAEWGLISALSRREITGGDALRMVGFHLHDLHPDDGEVLRRVILKDLRAGIGASTVNKAFPGTVPEFAYCRCSLPKASDIDKWDWSLGVYVQLKADGSFCRAARTHEGVRCSPTWPPARPGTRVCPKLPRRAWWLVPAWVVACPPMRPGAMP